MNYVREGYLPNYPYHMISDEEVFNAFLVKEVDSDTGGYILSGYFADKYPCVDDSLKIEYNTLVDAIIYHLNKYLEVKDYVYEIPDWIYSYMLGQVIAESSEVIEKHDLFVLMNLDNFTDTWTKEISQSCLSISKAWVSKLPADKVDNRPPTIFGEPHVIKSLRLLSADVLS